jgi:DNA-binding transcriptional LysR family regulator
MKRASSLGLLPTLLAIAETRSPLKAAELAGVSASTMYRHINALETKVGTKLFDRLPEGWQPTTAGEDAIQLARDVEKNVSDLEARLRIKTTKPQGPLVISVSDELATRYLAPQLVEFRQRYPDVVPVVHVSNVFADLARHEADVAIRPSKDPGETLIGRKVGQMRHAIYGARSYIKKHGRPTSIAGLAGHQICAYDQAIKNYDVASWMEGLGVDYKVAARFNVLSSLSVAVQAGLGLAVLPCYVGDQLPGCVAVLDVEDGLAVDIWLVAHRSRKGDPTVRAFFEFFAAVIQRDAALFRGAPLGETVALAV